MSVFSIHAALWIEHLLDRKKNRNKRSSLSRSPRLDAFIKWCEFWECFVNSKAKAGTDMRRSQRYGLDSWHWEFFSGTARNWAKGLFHNRRGWCICAWWEAVKAGRNSDVTGETGGVSEGVEGLPLECAVHYCQVNATQMLSLSLCIYLSIKQNV